MVQQQRSTLALEDLGSSGTVPGVLAVSSQRSVPQQNSTLGNRGLLETATQQPFPVWRGRMDRKYGLSYFTPYIVYSSRPPASLRQFIVDPTNPSSRQPVMHVDFPQGSYSTSSDIPGGTLLYAYPMGNGVPIAYYGATLEYDVYFPPDFPFNKGGKLPGLGGGPRGCGGGADPISCWSVRLMWRREGAGEAYMYVPEGQQGADFCDQPPYTDCNYAWGVSLARGSFYFTPGSWHRMALTVRMNDVGQANGSVEVKLNGKRKLYYDQVNYRTKPGIQVDSIYYCTFFGGNDATWAPPHDTYLLFKNVRIYSLDPPSITTSVDPPSAATVQVAVTLPLQDEEPRY
ncbi:hypothetical protein N2152v2_010517 [Parachlorella kessleri]